MAILHGSWTLDGAFLVWGEVWQTSKPVTVDAAAPSVPPYPMALTEAELAQLVAAQLPTVASKHWVMGHGAIAMPTATPSKRRRKKKGETFIAPLDLLAQHSTDKLAEPLPPLQPWQVTGYRLTASQTIALLEALPLGLPDASNAWIGGDLRFWSHVARWSLDLIARSKFFPHLERQGLPTAATPTPEPPQVSPASEPSSSAASDDADDPIAESDDEKNYTWRTAWTPLLDGRVDRDRLVFFTQQMPAVCRTYSLQQSDQLPYATPLLPQAQALLRHFLTHLLSSQINPAITSSPPKLEPYVQTWLKALGSKKDEIPAAVGDRIQEILFRWSIPLQTQLKQFRTCFHLTPPPSGKTAWKLSYSLQAEDSADFIVDAATLWSHPVEQLSYQGRVITNPQETLLEGLGRAARLYPQLEASLDDAAPTGCSLTPKEAYDFIKTVAWRLQDNGLSVVLPESLANQEAIANRLGLKISAELPRRGATGVGLNSLLRFKWELSIGGQTLTKAEFEQLAKQEIPLAEVNGEWVELRSNDIKSAREFFASRRDQPNLSLEDALRISTGDAQTISKLPVVNFESSGALEELVTTLTGTQTVQAITAPDTFKGQLRPYQERGVGWMAFLQQWGLGACLADDMGLGKTVQMIAFLLHLKQKESLTAPVLLICPTSVLGNWEREAYRFGPSLKVKVHHGPDRPQGKALVSATASTDLLISSYALVHRDLKSLKQVEWLGIVLDEAQNIKNADAKQSQAVRELEADFRIALTGTPVENRLTELWAIMDFLNPGYLGPKNFFRRRFAMPIERYGDTDSLKTLRSLVQPFILRRLKTDSSIIQDLPEKQEMAVFCGLTQAQGDLYQQLVDATLADIESETGIKRRGMVLALLTKLKQVCNHPLLYNKPKSAKVAKDFADQSAKVQRLDAMLEEALAEGDRALIFTQFAEWGKLLKTHLEKQFGEVLFLYGSTSKAKREEMVDRFQKDPQGPRILLLSLKAGGVGLNLTRANHVFHFDRWWNPAVENQATDRAFRIGQTKNVQVHKFVCSGTLEERIHEMIESKKALAEQVVGTGEDWLGEMDSDALRDLLLLDRNTIIED